MIKREHQSKINRLARRKQRIRKRVVGTAERPRLSVERSVKHIYAQLIDDDAGKTIVFVSSTAKTTGGKTKTEKAQWVGKRLAELAKEKGIENAVFDRGGYRYHGRVKAVADGARDGGLKF